MIAGSTEERKFKRYLKTQAERDEGEVISRKAS
jgi:hypothetical protein